MIYCQIKWAHQDNPRCMRAPLSLSELIMNIILQTIYYLLERKIRYGSQDKPQTTRMGESSFTLSLSLSTYMIRGWPRMRHCASLPRDYSIVAVKCNHLNPILGLYNIYGDCPNVICHRVVKGPFFLSPIPYLRDCNSIILQITINWQNTVRI